MSSAAARRTPCTGGGGGGGGVGVGVSGAPIQCYWQGRRRRRRISNVIGGLQRRYAGYFASNHDNQASKKALCKYIRYHDYALK